ncbi:MAG: hypothetical protein ACRC2R_26555 [Xenococcaceae cyanobacterium]
MSQMFGFDVQTDFKIDRIQAYLQTIWTDVSVDVFKLESVERIICEFFYFYRWVTPREEILQIANYLTSIATDRKLFYRSCYPVLGDFYDKMHSETLHLEILYSEEYTDATPKLGGADMDRFLVKPGTWKIDEKGKLSNLDLL